MVNHTEQPGFECGHSLHCSRDCEFVDYKGEKLLEKMEKEQGKGYKLMTAPEAYDAKEANKQRSRNNENRERPPRSSN